MWYMLLKLNRASSRVKWTWCVKLKECPLKATERLWFQLKVHYAVLVEIFYKKWNIILCFYAWTNSLCCHDWIDKLTFKHNNIVPLNVYKANMFCLMLWIAVNFLGEGACWFVVSSLGDRVVFCSLSERLCRSALFKAACHYSTPATVYICTPLVIISHSSYRPRLFPYINYCCLTLLHQPHPGAAVLISGWI